jgi:hypothetical protein
METKKKKATTNEKTIVQEIFLDLPMALFLITL